MDLTNLAEQNVWWQAPEYISSDPAMIALKEMEYIWEPHLVEAFDLAADLIYILKGPRQVGKTTLLKSLVKKLLREGIFHRNIFYFSCNLIDTYQELVEVLNLYLNWIRASNDQRIIILVDEISFVKDWQRAIKHFADPFIYHTLQAWIKDSPAPFQLAEKEIFDSVKASKLVESTVGIHLVRNFGKVYYWQNRKEIDFVLVVNGKIIPVEVKYRGSVPYAELTHLKKFHKAIVVTQSQLKLEENTLFIPASLFCLLISSKHGED